MDFPNGIGLLQTINLCGIRCRRETYMCDWSPRSQALDCLSHYDQIWVCSL